MDRFERVSNSMGIIAPKPHGNRFSCIDVGSNSLRLMIGEEIAGRLVLAAEHGRTTRLAEGFTATRRRLSQRSIDRTLRSLGQLLMAARIGGAPRPRLAATEALRRADNADLFVDMVKRQFGATVEILDAAHEANLTFLAVRNHVRPHGSLTIADLGGGSLELGSGTADSVDWWRTFPLGCIQMTERFFAADPPGKNSWEHARQAAAEELAGLVPGDSPMVGCGGAFTSTVVLALESTRYDAAVIRGYRLTAERVAEIGRIASEVPLARRSRLSCITSHRAYLVPAGTAIIAALLESTTGWCLVSDRGLAWGLLLETWHRQRRGREEASPPAL